jgi:branched-chain amino acid transport system substrate-binding protein
MRNFCVNLLVVLLVGLGLNSAVQAAEPVRLAAIFSQTGIAAGHNAPLIQMVQLAVEQVNKTGGLLDRPVELLLLDNQSTAIGAALAAEEAVRLNVLAVIGAHWSSHSLAMAPILQMAEIPMISPGSTNPEVTLAGDFIFRACFVDSFQGKAMARFARSELKATSVVILKNIDEAYSLMLAEYFSSAFVDFNGKVLLDAGYRGKAVDFSNLLQQVKQLNPDILYIPGYTRDSGLLINQANALGIRAVFLGGDAWDDIYGFAGAAINGSYNSAPWHPEVPFSASAQLKNIYYDRYKGEITNLSAPLAYDAVMLLKAAVSNAQSLDRIKVRDALAAINDFPGATGQISFDQNGDPLGKEVIILKWEQGRPRYHANIHP